MLERSLEPANERRVLAIAEKRATLSEGMAPVHMDAEDTDIIEEAIAILRRDLSPCGVDDARKAVSVIQRTLSAKQLDDDVLDAYLAVWSEIPKDLLPKAVRETLATETYHKMPTPGFLVMKIKGEWDLRKRRIERLSRHVNKLRLVSMRR